MTLVFRGVLGCLAAGLVVAALSMQTVALAGNDRTSSMDDPLCARASHDGDIFWSDVLGHNSFDTAFRDPFGAVPNDKPFVMLRFRTCFNDVEQVRVRVWNSAEGREYWYNMSAEDGWSTEPTVGPVQYWRVRIPVPSHPTILYYFFELKDAQKVVYYTAKSQRAVGGGFGKFSADRDDGNSYQLTIYDKDFRVPGWVKGATIYQVFPDRFRNGDKANDPVDGQGFVYGVKNRKLNWNQKICDPRSVRSPCQYEMDNQFYGGDLQGVIDKLDYLKDLGIDALYLNPIFQSPSNHGYDTQDHLQINTRLGDDKVFDQLVSQAHARGMKLILDGVFNHVSADSHFFDLYRRYGNEGACQSPDSPYRNWFFLHYRTDANKARDVAGHQEWKFYECFQAGFQGIPYDAWAGYFSIPNLNWENPEVRKYFYAGGSRSVGPFWINRGANGWRLDVGGMIDPGAGVAPENTVWEDFRGVVKAQDPDSVIIGEEWGNSTSWLLGQEWDSVMNYRFRAILLNWMFDRCSGNGCANGVRFYDNNMNDGSFAGPIVPISEDELDLRLKTIQENYPAESWQAMMNLLGSHDTARVRFLLKMISQGDETLARKKLLFLSLFQFTYPGAPTIYYGDEAGLADSDVWSDGTWLSDPYSRATYPWADEGLTPDTTLIAHYKKMSAVRHSSPALQSGDFTTLVADRLAPGSSRRVFAFRRSSGDAQAIVVLNRGTEAADVSLPVSAFLPDGSHLDDALGGGSYTVAGGKLDVKGVQPLWGQVLVLKK